jgi:ATP-dependent Lon protease
VLIPEENRKDLVEMPKTILENLTIHPVKWIDEVLAYALAHKPAPVQKDDKPAEEIPAEGEDADKTDDRLRHH